MPNQHSRNCAICGPALRHLSFLQLAVDGLRCRPDHHLSIPSGPAATRSGPASLRTAAASDVLLEEASSSVHVSPVALRFFTSRCCRLVSDQFSIRLGTASRRHRLPRCRPAGSARAAPGSSGNDHNGQGAALPRDAMVVERLHVVLLHKILHREILMASSPSNIELMVPKGRRADGARALPKRTQDQ